MGFKWLKGGEKEHPPLDSVYATDSRTRGSASGEHFVEGKKPKRKQ